MDIREKLIDSLFHRILPERILTNIIKNNGIKDINRFMYECFNSISEQNFHGYSDDEKRLLYQSVYEMIAKGKSREEFKILSATPPFKLLSDYGDTILSIMDNVPVCNFRKVQNWREIYLLVGQDILITSWLAHKAECGNYYPHSFSWPAVINTDNKYINYLVGEGLAENHYHLYGSANIFAINWSKIMTHPEAMLSDQSWLEKRLQSHLNSGVHDNTWSGKKRLIYAAFIRSVLFERLQGSLKGNVEYNLKNFNLKYWSDQYAAHKVKERVIGLKIRYGKGFTQPYKNNDCCLDYAFNEDLFGDINSSYRLLAGERYFLFRCFRESFSGGFDKYTQWVFYVYLLLKNSFRSELIQVNDRVGFDNFQQYEKRKYMLWENDTPYWNEAYRLALNATMNENGVSSLEARISPKKSKSENIKLIYNIDRVKLFHDGRFIANGLQHENIIDATENEPYFFTLHFAKKGEDYVWRKYKNIFCRHNDLRKTYKKTAIEIAKALSSDKYFSKRVRGIDACANEVFCRPEVFGNVFRFLRGFPADKYRRNPFVKLQPSLSFTYHVGEDFLDIADGLRAVDEAVYFLNLKSGDRMGHALVLGVDPYLHYNTKSRTIIMPKQNLLDNFIWIYYRSMELNVDIPNNLKSYIIMKADMLLKEIFKETTKSEIGLRPWSTSDYYHSWYLRGDNPELYDWNGINYGRITGFDAFDSFALNSTNLIESLEELRNDIIVSRFFYEYHYGEDSRKCGNEKIYFYVTDEYIELMCRLQMAMQEYVNRLGIGIECNPSSNVLIGTFKSYKSHPIFRFNNVDLDNSSRPHQMHVSVNTDDQGIFDTSLPFEYALIASVLSLEKDENNVRKYSDRDIEKYLRNLQHMGNEQIFGEININ